MVSSVRVNGVFLLACMMVLGSLLFAFVLGVRLSDAKAELWRFQSQLAQGSDWRPRQKQVEATQHPTILRQELQNLTREGKLTKADGQQLLDQIDVFWSE